MEKFPEFTEAQKKKLIIELLVGFNTHHSEIDNFESFLKSDTNHMSFGKVNLTRTNEDNILFVTSIVEVETEKEKNLRYIYSIN